MRADAKKKCRNVLLLVIVLNIGLLCFLKFSRFFTDPLDQLFSTLKISGFISASSIVMPLGISYYTFSAVGYLLDIYWQRIESEKNYARFLLFEIFFLHILQGPIERYDRLGKRLKGEFRFQYEQACYGLQMMLYGFFKKLVIADRINIFVNSVYQDYETTPGSFFALAFLLDVVFIYADFSGCMDIARGAAQIMGIEMDLNFNHPFSARSIVEFWRRWHMSLGSWFKDYVYYPISVSKLVKSLSRWCTSRQFSVTLSRGIITFLPVTVTWLLTGLWHGTGKPYIAWGIYYAFWIFLSVVFGEWCSGLADKIHVRTHTFSWRAFQCTRTALIFAGGRLLTRPNSLWISRYALKQAVFHPQVWSLFDDSLFGYGLDWKNWMILIVSILAFGMISMLQTRYGSMRIKIAGQILPFRWAVWLGVLLFVVIFGIYGPGYDAASFVYMEY